MAGLPRRHRPADRPRRRRGRRAQPPTHPGLRRRTRSSCAARRARAPGAGWLHRAETLDDLAVELGLDAGVLRETIERFNADVPSGVDRDFHRGENANDRYYSDARVKPNPSLGPIETPPFYAVEVYPSDLGTKAGLVTDAGGRVLDTARRGHRRPVRRGQLGEHGDGPVVPGRGGDDRACHDGRLRGRRGAGRRLRPGGVDSRPVSSIEDRLNLRGKAVVVAGAGGGGIGTAICRMLAEAGVAVGAIDLGREQLVAAEQAVGAVDGRIVPLVADLREPDQVARWSARPPPSWGRSTDSCTSRAVC